MGFCSCIPPPASLQPRKVYNVLVPDVFPPQPPPVTEAVPNSIRRKIAKLHEYVQRSPGKIAKVWHMQRQMPCRCAHAAGIG